MEVIKTDCGLCINCCGVNAYVEDGKLAATIAQQPSEMGRLGVEKAVEFLGGASVEAYIPVDLALVLPE